MVTCLFGGNGPILIVGFFVVINFSPSKKISTSEYLFSIEMYCSLKAKLIVSLGVSQT
jgi:hypothetical protein